MKRDNVFKLKECWFRLDIRKKFFHNKSGQAREQVPQRGGRFLNSGNIQGQLRWSSVQPNLVEGVPAQVREWTRWSLKGPFQLKLLYESIKV